MPSLPPLVSPAAELTPAERERYSRQTILPELGEDGQRRLKNARVLVIGAGGLGSPILLYLAAAGVGTLGAVDFDEVELSNLGRQIVHGCADVGRLKTQSAADRIASLDPQIRFQQIQERLTSANADDLFRKYDLVVDGSDNFATRYLANDAAARTGRPYVWGSIHRFAGQVSVFWADAPDGRGIDYRDLYPEPPAEGSVPNCAEGGVLGVVCGVVGSLMAAEAVKLVAGVGEPLLGTLLLYDALAGRVRTVSVRRDPDRAPADQDPAAVAEEPAQPRALRPAELEELLSGARPPALVDVREDSEWARGHIAGATHIPLGRIESAARAGELPTDRMVVVYCALGPRSAHAARLLQAAGVDNVGELKGGLVAWQAARSG
ncbi:MAG: molybdopterin-synthase adenylyltransferase MoeB [Segniliparus sp.]|uniref:molybdopterin-synthase adenylyltransferase MoeB n=1 Tax=Segniliparus sp. TaxID=2804064 RepID=UPI003F3BD264